MNTRRAGRADLEAEIGELERRLGAMGRTAGPARLDLEMGIRDFGPIRDAHIRLRPLTVFIGPNGSGKSYAALLAHAAVSLLGSGPHAVAGAYRRGAGAGRTGGARQSLKAGGGRNEFLVTGRSLGALSRDAAGAIAAAFSGQVEKNFGVRPSSLVRSGASSARIEIHGVAEMSIPRGGRGQAARLARPVSAAALRDALAGEAGGGVRAGGGGGTEIACTFSGAVDARSAYDRLLSRAVAAALGGHGHAVPAAASYLPASRAGIAESYKALLSSVARSHAHGQGRGGAPRMKAAVYEILAAMMEMGGGKGDFSRAADELERDALRGKISLRDPAGGLAPDIYYANRRKMPISQASSAASELAPVVLLLRHVMKKGDLLFVEEPESHMHPESQVAVARCMVRLVRAGLNVAVTTHSTYIVERLSAYLRAGQMTATERSRAGISRGLYLEAGEVAPYLFDMRRGGTTVKAVEHSPQEGISQEEFMRVNEALHEENIRADKFVG